MPSFRELLAATKAEIREVDTAEADELPHACPAPSLLDVREPEEYEQGAIPGALHIARGNLESTIESRVPDKADADHHPLRLRRPLRLRGQDPRRARLHGRRVDGRRLQQVEGREPRLGGPPQPHRRAAQPLPAPPAPARGRHRGPAEAARLPGAAARRRRPRLAGRPLPGRGRRRHDRHHRHGRRRRVEPPAPDPPQHRAHRRPQGRLGQEDPHPAQPRRRRRHLRRAPRRRQRDGHPPRAGTSSSTAPTTSPPASS